MNATADGIAVRRPGGAAAPAIEIRGLVKTFATSGGTVRAVDGLDLTVRPGEIVAFLGPNGAGKTTTIDMLLGLARPDAGEVRVFGAAPAEAIAAGLVSAVMQSGGLLPDLIVGDTVRLVKRTVLFALVMPQLFFIIFGASADFRSRELGSGNTTGYVMVSMAVYGALLATSTGAARVAVERAAGWSRQLRLTPLHPPAYIASKIAVAMVLGLFSVTVVFAVGAVFGAHLSASAWVSCFLIAWLGSLVFAAFGLFMGYLLPSENVMQLLGVSLALLSFAGGLFNPLHGWLDIVSKLVPTNGIAVLARAPFAQPSAVGIVLAIANVVTWAAIFTLGSAYLLRRDTAR
ncbi:ABC transporter permease [Nocardia niigatensis]